MAIDWRDNLLPASIGGVRFFCSEVRTTGGRRTTVRELPLRDIPATEDLGRRGRRFAVTGAVMGDDYQEQRDAVLAVLESEGPHRFTHPWRGEIDVVLADGSSVDITESEREGGWARLSFELVEAGDETRTVKAKVATDAALQNAADAAAEASSKELQKSLGLSDILDAAAAAVGVVTNALTKTKSKIMGALGLGDSLSTALADLKSAAYSLAQTPSELAAQLNAITGQVLGLIRDAAEEDVETYPGGGKVVRADAALDAAQEMAAVDPVTPPPYPGGPVDEEDQEAERAIGKHARVCAIAGVAALFADLELESSDAATKVLGTMGVLIDALLIDPTTSDDLFSALTDTKAALDAHLVSLSASLPAVQTYTPAASTPALLIAFWLYGDPTRDLEVVGRNRLADPNFVGGGAPLQVLLDG